MINLYFLPSWFIFTSFGRSFSLIIHSFLFLGRFILKACTFLGLGGCFSALICMDAIFIIWHTDGATPKFIHLLKSFEMEHWFPEPALSNIKDADYPALYLLPSPWLNETSLESFVSTSVIEISMSTVFFPLIILSCLSRFHSRVLTENRAEVDLKLQGHISIIFNVCSVFLIPCFLSGFMFKCRRILAPCFNSPCED